MAIRFEHQPLASAGLAAYAAGQEKARERALRTTLDLYRDQQKLKERRDLLQNQQQFQLNRDAYLRWTQQEDQKQRSALQESRNQFAITQDERDWWRTQRKTTQAEIDKISQQHGGFFRDPKKFADMQNELRILDEDKTTNEADKHKKAVEIHREFIGGFNKERDTVPEEQRPGSEVRADDGVIYRRTQDGELEFKGFAKEPAMSEEDIRGGKSNNWRYTPNGVLQQRGWGKYGEEWTNVESPQDFGTEKSAWDEHQKRIKYDTDIDNATKRALEQGYTRPEYEAKRAAYEKKFPYPGGDSAATPGAPAASSTAPGTPAAPSGGASTAPATTAPAASSATPVTIGTDGKIAVPSTAASRVDPSQQATIDEFFGQSKTGTAPAIPQNTTPSTPTVVSPGPGWAATDADVDEYVQIFKTAQTPGAPGSPTNPLPFPEDGKTVNGVTYSTPRTTSKSEPSQSAAPPISNPDWPLPLNINEAMAATAKDDAKAAAKARRDSAARPTRTPEIAALQQEQADKKTAARARYEEVMGAAKQEGKSYADNYDPATAASTKSATSTKKSTDDPDVQETYRKAHDRKWTREQDKRQAEIDANQARNLGMTIPQYRQRKVIDSAISVARAGGPDAKAAIEWLKSKGIPWQQ